MSVRGRTLWVTRSVWAWMRASGSPQEMSKFSFGDPLSRSLWKCLCMERRVLVSDCQGFLPSHWGRNDYLCYTLCIAHSVSLKFERNILPFLWMKVLRRRYVNWRVSEKESIPDLLHSQAHIPQSSCCVWEWASISVVNSHVEMPRGKHLHQAFFKNRFGTSYILVIRTWALD